MALFRLVLSSVLIAALPLAQLAAQPSPAASTAVADTVPAPASAPTRAVARPALWKIADEDTTIWLFGTVHLLPADLDWREGPVNTALDSADELVTEIDMTPEALAKVAPMMASRGALPEGQSLRELMSEDQRAKYEAGMARIGLPENAFDRFKPWFASLAMLQTALAGSGFTDHQGAEKVLEANIADGVKRTALEAVSYQIEVLDGLPLDQQLAFLMSGAEDPAAAASMLGELVELWAAGNVDALGAEMNKALLSHPGLADRLLYARNANWATWIDARLEAPGTVFMAVGAGHLAGDLSVQDYLAKFEIEAVRVQ